MLEGKKKTYLLNNETSFSTSKKIKNESKYLVKHNHFMCDLILFREKNKKHTLPLIVVLVHGFHLVEYHVPQWYN